MNFEDKLDFFLEKLGSNRSKITISIEPNFIAALYNHILKSHQDLVTAQGFLQGKAPLSYLEKTFKKNILENLKETFLTHCIFKFLYQKLIDQKIVTSSEPILKEVSLDPKKGGKYVFEIVQHLPPIRPDWKKLPFRPPARKKYKDIDKHAEDLIKEELKNAENFKKENPEKITCQKNNWVLLETTLVDEKGNAILGDYSDHIWLRLGDEFIDQDTYQLLQNKTVGEKFITQNDLLQEYLGNSLNVKYNFLIKILEIIPSTYLSLDFLKQHFKLKTNKELNNKLIEVFSFRNDISQRRETVSAIFRLLFKYYPYKAPKELVEIEKRSILDILQANPDYNIYKARPDFTKKINLMAEIKVKEYLFINYLTCQERIVINDKDVIPYLHLTQKHRTKEFIHFHVPTFRDKVHEIPIPHNLIKFYSAHEKTLNYIINYLSKKA